MSLRIGIDIGSTTVKVVVLDEQNKLLFRSYERHYSKTRERACETLHTIQDQLTGKDVRLVITGSAGLGVAKAAGIDFVQEVYATAAAVNTYIPGTDAVIELGGEDAKIIFFGGALEERMNGSCAGGTGAFIDQMATLMNVSIDELDRLSLKHEKIYPIASRCGVFAKSDIQPILNQGGRKEDVAASIFQAVVDQTVAGLTQGRELKGKIVFLGGPLHFLYGLRERFVETLHLDGEHAVFPEDGDCFAAMGAALCAADYATAPFEDVLKKLEESVETVIAGAQRKSAVISPEEKRIVAYHETGHALVAALQSHSAPVQKITIIPRTSGALGYTMQVDQGDKYLLTKQELENKIATFTGGRAAEELVFGEITTGASNDIEQATKLARAMITRYGMSEDFDMVALETVSNQYLGGDASLACSADTQNEIDRKVVELVKRQHEKASKILADNRGKLDELAKYLYEKETITGEEFMSILNKGGEEE